MVEEKKKSVTNWVYTSWHFWLVTLIAFLLNLSESQVLSSDIGIVYLLALYIGGFIVVSFVYYIIGFFKFRK